MRYFIIGEIHFYRGASYNKAMFDALNNDFKKVVSDWYEVNIKPVFEQVKQVIIVDLGKAEKLNIEFGYW